MELDPRVPKMAYLSSMVGSHRCPSRNSPRQCLGMGEGPVSLRRDNPRMSLSYLQ